MSSRRFRPLLALLALAPYGSVFALGLGEITLGSSLNEPLRAEIRLRGTDDLSADQILVRLASSADFERSGVERLYSLTEMRFEVETGPSGEGVVRLRTDQPVREPYLDFLLEVRWPNGRVLREYTVLLDLPTYSAEPAKPVQAPVTKAPARPSVTPRSEGGGAWSGGSSYDVRSGDTLWGIAKRTRPSGVSVQQMIDALLQQNPEAFVNGDIDRLRAGAVLRIPAELSSGPAGVATVPSAEPAATGAESAPASSALPEEDSSSSANDAYLRLAGDKAADGGGSIGGQPGATGSGSGATEDLATVQENLSAKERENAELASRVKALEEQVKDYQRVVDLKSQGMADAQAAAATPKPPASAPASSPVTPAPVEEGDFLSSLLDNSTAVAGAIAAAFLAVLGFLFIRRRVQASRYAPLPSANQRFRSSGRESEPELVIPVEPVAAPVVRAAAVAPTVAAEPPPVPSKPFDLPKAGPAVHADETPDPLAEADMLIAYGRHARAMEVLRSAIAQDPEQIGLRLKLMEILASRNEQGEFLAEYDRILALGSDDDVQAARTLVVETGHRQWLADLDAPPGIQTEEEPPTPAPQPLRSLASAGGEPEPELATFDLDLHAPVLDAPAGAAAPGATADLDLDLSMDGLDEAIAESLEDESSALESADFGELELGSLALDEHASSGPTELPMEFGELDVPLESVPEAPASVDQTETLVFDAEEALALESPESPGSASAALQESPEDAADFDLLEGTDEVETRLELARAFIDMGDVDGARDILAEVVAEGSESQREAASTLLATLKPA